MNLFSRNKKRNERSALKSVTPNFAFPPLKQNFDSSHLYIVPRVLERATGKITHLDNALHQHTRAILVGAAGMGKSSALAFISAQVLAPVLSLADYHAQALPEKFSNENFILLDDVSGPAHLEYLAALAQKFPNAKIWAATRAEKFSPQNFSLLELQTLNEREIVSFAEAWFPQNEKHKRINRAAQDFIASVQANAGTRELAITPLDLYLLLQVYEPASKQEQVVEEKVALPMLGSNAATPFAVPQRTHAAQLPSRRAQLFDAYINAKLKNASDSDFAARAVEGIALSTKRGQLASDDHLARGFDFLEKRASGRVEFRHSLLQDFLTARALRRNPDFEPMREHLFDAEWRDVALFYAGLGDATEIVQAALGDGKDVAGKDVAGRDVPPERLYLAAYALAATAEPNAKLLEQTVKGLVARAWEDNDENAMRALGSLRNNMASDFFAAKLKDKNAEVRLRAAYILGKLHTDRALEYLLPQLRDPSDDVRAQVIASLGSSRSERVIEPLLVALRGDPRVAASDTRMKIAAAKALGEFGTDKAVPALIVDLQVSDDDVREQAILALEKIRGSFAVKPLTEIAQTDKKEHVRAAAMRVLQNMHGE